MLLEIVASKIQAHSSSQQRRGNTEDEDAIKLYADSILGERAPMVHLCHCENPHRASHVE